MKTIAQENCYYQRSGSSTAARYHYVINPGVEEAALSPIYLMAHSCAIRADHRRLPLCLPVSPTDCLIKSRIDSSDTYLSLGNLSLVDSALKTSGHRDRGTPSVVEDGFVDGSTDTSSCKQLNGSHPLLPASASGAVASAAAAAARAAAVVATEG
uniref:Uncharacterized protein n=1 Tax=Setaria digitata TaxID=48799 RepID=A0A915Q416_9BILA